MLLGKIDLWREAIEDPTEGGDKKRVQIREQTLLGKPIGQAALVNAFVLMRERCTGVSETELCERLNRIPWGAKESIWVNVLLHSTGKVIAGRSNRTATNFIAHLGGATLTAEETETLLQVIHGDSWNTQSLPDPV